EVLCSLFGELTGNEAVGATSNFFALGGDSIQAMKLVASIKNKFGRAVPVRTIFRHPTPRALSLQIVSDSAETSIFVPLMEGTEETTIIAIHPGGGFSSVYSAVAKNLTQYRWVGIDAELNDEGDYTAKTIADIAESYLSGLEREFLGRPIILLGWSFGGNIAQHMTSLMCERGNPPVALVLLDSVADGPRRDLTKDRNSVLFEMATELGMSVQKELPTAEWIALISTELEKREIIPKGLKSDAFLKAVDRTIEASNMIADHQPAPHYAPTLLVKALVDSSPIGAYEKWRSLSSQYQQAGVNVSHGVLCTPSSSYSLAPIIEKFLLENKGG
ncbi:MAG: alpha/beta fold hydrolase, partial [Rhodospirillaceae bacterium TMED63]